MAGSVRVLDSWAVIAFFENQRGSERVAKLFKESRDAGASLLISLVNVGEVWYSLARAHSEAVADTKIAELQALGVEFVVADWETTRQAALFKTKGNIAYADCFAAALAKQNQAGLVTGDGEFKQVERAVKILWL